MENKHVIETERLILRHFQEDDAEDMYKNYCSSDNVTKHLIWSTHPNLEATKEYLKTVLNDYKNGEAEFRFAIVWKETNEVIGVIDYMPRNEFTYELGWVLGEKFWGQGIMPEAGKATLQLVFDSGAIRIQAKHFAGNPKSGRAMEKIGMTYEGTLKRYAKNNKGETCDTKMYSIINPKFLEENENKEVEE